MKDNRHIYPMGVIGNCSFIGYIDINGECEMALSSAVRQQFYFWFPSGWNKNGGEFSVLPAGIILPISQHYIKNTNILVTEFHSRRVIILSPILLPGFISMTGISGR